MKLNALTSNTDAAPILFSKIADSFVVDRAFSNPLDTSEPLRALDELANEIGDHTAPQVVARSCPGTLTPSSAMSSFTSDRMNAPSVPLTASAGRLAAGSPRRPPNVAFIRWKLGRDE